jgi:hypothetical protein
MVFSDDPELSLQPLKWLLLTISNDLWVIVKKLVVEDYFSCSDTWVILLSSHFIYQPQNSKDLRSSWDCREFLHFKNMGN